MNLLETLNYYNIDYQFPRPTFQGPFGTDKELWGYISLFYKDFFEPIKNSNIKLVEIGTMYGGSLYLWEKYFTNAEIVGIELNPHHHFTIPIEGVEYGQFSDTSFDEYLKTSNIKFYKNDAYDINFINSTFEDNSIDILLDDGPHTRYFQKIVTDLYYKKIKKGGYIIIEDVIPEDIDFLKNYYNDNCNNSEVTLAFSESYKKQPWGNERFNIITINKK